MNHIDEETQRLLSKFREGKCTPEELQRLNHIYILTSKSNLADSDITDIEETGNEIWSRLQSTNFQQKNNFGKRIKRQWQWAAAVVFFITVGSILYSIMNRPVVQVTAVTKHADLAPGKNGATLTLANGKKITLSNFNNKTVAEEGGVRVVKDKEGELVYHVDVNTVASKPGFNTLTTGNGEQFQVKLPDGTKVWLNSGSALTYPTQFNNNGERTVMLTGEAYFEVATSKDFNGRKNPFIVQTEKQMVKVLGTHFNINSYNDEADFKTTLLEGSIELTVKDDKHSSVILKPNQQATLNLVNNKISVKHLPAAEDEVAWKEGLFHFNDTEIKSVMRQLARWYDVKVVYKGAIPDARFTGEMYKSLSALKVLDGLSYTGLHFTISQHQIIVTN